MASPRRSKSRRIPLASALAAGLALASSSAPARAEPPPVASPSPPAEAAPGPPAPLPAVTPPGRYGPRAPELTTPVTRVPMYFYLPGEGDEPTPGMPGGPKKRVWYGWQTLFILGSSATIGIVTTLAGASTRADGVTLVGLSVGGAGLIFGGPIVHWAHGNTAKGFGALGLNFGVPLVSGGLGVAVACIAGACGGSSEGFGVFSGLLFGGSAGLLGSLIIDVTALDYDTSVPVSATASRKAPGSGWTLVPDLHITREKSTFGFAGVF